ncbi:hypothetical protein SINU_05825 [Sporolactobacillus inulinus CASD]|jgi:hypothetical protein|uniref:Uncharacterized protein n=1 Tax=Sporolactobacillus inulinus CASD TaxID=1069536 RepID=A0A0U1QPV7_9BACL|nr:hypothetical protein SINU_05825 [Sporolactobacillus inulinus CASD]GEB75755.1 hypothetical protein SIN01_01000 [Sporolactobacillus inulinus]
MILGHAKGSASNAQMLGRLRSGSVDREPRETPQVPACLRRILDCPRPRPFFDKMLQIKYDHVEAMRYNRNIVVKYKELWAKRPIED